MRKAAAAMDRVQHAKRGQAPAERHRDQARDDGADSSNAPRVHGEWRIGKTKVDVPE
jgi:hypothetical protein